MTISSTTNRFQYTGNGVTTSFAFNSPFYASSDLIVTRTQISTGVDTTLTSPTDYSVTGGSGSTGSITTTVAPTSDQRITIERSIPYTQTTDYKDNEKFRANEIETNLDKLTIMTQQVLDKSNLALKLPSSSTLSNLTLPNPTANNLLGWNAGATSLENKVPADLSFTTVTPFAAQLLDDVDASAARTTLGAAGLASPTFTGTVTIPTLTLTNALTVANGGTGQSSYTVGDILYASGTTALSKLAAGTNGHVLTLSGGVPAWAAPIAGAMELITTSTASNSATIDFNNLNSTYDHYIVVMSDVQPATDDAFFRLRTSSNNGSSYDAGAGNYRYSGTGNSTGGSLAQYSSASDTHIALTWPTATAGLSNVSTEAFSGTVIIYKPSGSTNFTQVNFTNAYTPAATSQFISTVGGGCRTAAADVDAIRFLMSSGNIASGTFKLYGVRNA